ncbi:MAG TPA: peptide ABC transporter substrate-binding protein [Thermomicrobiales bacterium]|nr:peptide ABC transporter substrate-binding protein [Thermomicrobiales bacterium]
MGLNPLTSSYYSDHLGACLVLEPLMHYRADGTVIPNLVTDVPAVENGMLAPDRTFVTYQLLPDVTWSDGEPFTAEDVRFTWEWNRNPDNRSWANTIADRIAAVDIVDDLTVTVRFANPEPTWFEAHTGTYFGFILPEHVLGNVDDPETAAADFRNAPIGTGPYVVEEFKTWESATFVANARYREPTKPWFSRVVINQYANTANGEEDFFTRGEYDFYWDLRGSAATIRDLADASDTIDLVLVPSTIIEGVSINLSDPRTEVDGQVSEMNTPHPILSDPAVREAIALAIDREAIAAEAYFGLGLEPPAKSFLDGHPGLEDEATGGEYDPDRARQLLEDAGWILAGDVREKDGITLDLTYQSIIDSTQDVAAAIVKDNLDAVGFRIEPRRVDAQIFRDPMPGNDQSEVKFRADLQYFEFGAPSRPLPIDRFRSSWYAGQDGENVPQAANTWQGGNVSRYLNPEFDALWDEANTETDLEAQRQLCVELNDMVIAGCVTIPYGHRRRRCASVKSLDRENMDLGPFSHLYWNIANWRRNDE